MKKKYNYFGWQDCCPLCGSINVKNNKCRLCGFKWKKGYVYFSKEENLTNWKDGKYIDIDKMDKK